MSRHLIGNGLSQQYISNCYPPSSAQAGTLWFDSGEQKVKVYDGTTWIAIEAPEPTLSFEAEMALDKIISMMHDQPRLSEMADKYPLVADALGELEVALKLCQNLDDD